MAGTKKKFERKYPLYLERWRAFHGNMSQQDLAAIMGTSKSRVSDVERGYNRYNEEFLRDAAEAFGCEPWELLAYDPAERQVFDAIWAKLTEKERAEAAEFVRYLISKRLPTVKGGEGEADVVGIAGGAGPARRDGDHARKDRRSG